MTDQNIRTLFRLAESRSDALATSRDSSSLMYRENLAGAIAAFDNLRQLADRLSLFSPNETLEDIATGDLQYACLSMVYRMSLSNADIFSSIIV
jgi:immunoglobulin-binding protein 1